ncbi:16S rRNA (guanine(527)-N(7))-methyltransferase RsmG [Sphingomonas aracearum]|uniref:Ribosomal RNA small subunit methyltransferase G n=1 Tax=Sphingomonas aracearum TaxID=2283317 RepID=A0A369VQC3_9SPHN|nr:16S rRNA (guanine(527)-N(7))-methyltransferase RsmG [Sphingomonas aracearum]RDE04594.1 16S rRNA (guanine(527)-N(7))-methyltransferase RsmG [Sphingomonas aracearum]
MTEEEAKNWLEEHFGVEAVARLEPIVAAVLAENARQNLIAPSTVDHIWERHVVDSAQLILLTDRDARSWLDIGTGAGFPGMIVAALCAMPVTMVEPRRRRADFLDSLSRALRFEHAQVRASKIETVEGQFDIISARAVASVDTLFVSASGAAHGGTRWVLPKGRAWSDELDVARRYWRGTFHVEQSVTSPEARIIVAQGVSRA